MFLSLASLPLTTPTLTLLAAVTCLLPPVLFSCVMCRRRLAKFKLNRKNVRSMFGKVTRHRKRHVSRSSSNLYLSGYDGNSPQFQPWPDSGSRFSNGRDSWQPSSRRSDMLGPTHVPSGYSNNGIASTLAVNGLSDPVPSPGFVSRLQEELNLGPHEERYVGDVADEGGFLAAVGGSHRRPKALDPATGTGDSVDAILGASSTEPGNTPTQAYDPLYQAFKEDGLRMAAGRLSHVNRERTWSQASPSVSEQRQPRTGTFSGASRTHFDSDTGYSTFPRTSQSVPHKAGMLPFHGPQPLEPSPSCCTCDNGQIQWNTPSHGSLRLERRTYGDCIVFGLVRPRSHPGSTQNLQPNVRSSSRQLNPADQPQDPERSWAWWEGIQSPNEGLNQDRESYYETLRSLGYLSHQGSRSNSVREVGNRHGNLSNQWNGSLGKRWNGDHSNQWNSNLKTPHWKNLQSPRGNTRGVVFDNLADTYI